MSGSAEPDRAFSLHRDGDIVMLRWLTGVEITGGLAAAAMAAVDELNGDRTRPLLVDMSGTARVTKEARDVFSRECQVSRMALVGRSAVDRILVNFGLKVTGVPIPARFFTSITAGLTWLREHEVTDA